MTKLVLPPPQQAFVTTAGHVTEPWRSYLDRLTHGINNARQAILGANITSGTSQFDVVVPSEWRSAEIEFYGLLPDTSAVAIRARVSTDSGATFIGSGTEYSYVRHIVSVQSTVPSVAAGTGDDHIIIAANVAALSSGGITGKLGMIGLASTSARVFFNSVFLQAGTTPNVTVANGGAYVAVGSPVNAFRVFVTTGSFSTGSYAVYGER